MKESKLLKHRRQQEFLQIFRSKSPLVQLLCRPMILQEISIRLSQHFRLESQTLDMKGKQVLHWVKGIIQEIPNQLYNQRQPIKDKFWSKVSSSQQGRTSRVLCNPCSKLPLQRFSSQMKTMRAQDKRTFNSHLSFFPMTSSSSNKDPAFSWTSPLKTMKHSQNSNSTSVSSDWKRGFERLARTTFFESPSYSKTSRKRTENWIMSGKMKWSNSNNFSKWPKLFQMRSKIKHQGRETK